MMAKDGMVGGTLPTTKAHADAKAEARARRSRGRGKGKTPFGTASNLMVEVAKERSTGSREGVRLAHQGAIAEELIRKDGLTELELTFALEVIQLFTRADDRLHRKGRQTAQTATGIILDESDFDPPGWLLRYMTKKLYEAHRQQCIEGDVPMRYSTSSTGRGRTSSRNT